MYFFFLFVGTCNASFSENSNASKDVKNIAVETIQIKSENNIEELCLAKQQIELLKSEIRLAKNFQAQLLETVYWALSGVFVVVGLLIGFGWFVNFKVYERDKNFLKSELEITVKTETISRFEKIHEELKEDIKSQSKIIEENINAPLSQVEQRVFDLEYFRLFEEMNNNDRASMALTSALSLLAMCNKRKEGKVPEIIKFMIKKFDEGGKLTADEIARISLILDSLPSNYKALIDKLNSKISASDIF